MQKMEKKLATLVSYLAHPLLIPMLGVLLISKSGTYAAEIDQNLIQFIYLSVFILTFMLPLGLIPLFYYSGLVKSTEFTERRERLIPLYITLVMYVSAYYVMRKIPMSQIYKQFLFAASLSILLILIISYFWKISAHMVGWGGLTGLIISLSLKYNLDLLILLITGIICSGFIGYARLRLDAHSPSQVYCGYLLGYFLVLATFRI
jgi:membrane-associated phospholipid phosphatase